MLRRMPDAPLAVTTMPELLDAVAQVSAPGRAIALVGGADFVDEGDVTAIAGFFGVLVEVLEATRTTVLDGGTDSGVMRLIGAARTAAAATFPLIGIVPGGVLERPGRTGEPISLARDHSLVVLVPGSSFGDEDPWLFEAADHLNGGSAPTLVVNGGRLTLEEASMRLGLGHLVVAVAGSGRAADELAEDPDLPASLRLRVIPVSADAARIAAAFEGG